MDVRKLFKESQTSREPKNLPEFAQKLADDTLLCVICNTIVRHHLLWDDHQSSEKHQRNIRMNEQEVSRIKKPKIDGDEEVYTNPTSSVIPENSSSHLDKEFFSFMAEVEAIQVSTKPLASEEPQNENIDKRAGDSNDELADEKWDEEVDEEHRILFTNAARRYIQGRENMKSSVDNEVEHFDEEYGWRHKGVK